MPCCPTTSRMGLPAIRWAWMHQLESLCFRLHHAAAAGPHAMDGEGPSVRGAVLPSASCIRAHHMGCLLSPRMGSCMGPRICSSSKTTACAGSNATHFCFAAQGTGARVHAVLRTLNRSAGVLATSHTELLL